MSIYSFKITKGIFQLTLSTTDKELVVSQFDKWVKQSSNYVQKQKIQQYKDNIREQIDSEKEITQKNIDEQLKTSKSEENEIVENTSENNSCKSIASETISTELAKKDLDIFYAPPTEKKEIAKTEQVNTEKQGFDNILEHSMTNPHTELSFKPSPSIKKDNAFLNYINSRKIERKIDYLLLTAYYFTQYEQKPRFTLKQLNAKLMQNVALIIDHAILQEAINRDYIECLPDLTGLVGSSEYRLTSYGEKVILDD